MKIYTLFIIALLFVFVGCSTSTVEKTEETDQPKTENSEKKDSEETDKTENKEDSKGVVESPKAGMSPTEVLKGFSKATQTKDAEKIKSFLSKGSLAEIEKSAKEQKVTVEELLTQGAEEDPVDPDMKNEKIDGETATVEVKNETLGYYDVMPFVKEDGVWKIALDKFMADMLKKINEAQKQAPPIGEDKE
jgi:hypothetical protein